MFAPTLTPSPGPGAGSVSSGPLARVPRGRLGGGRWVPRLLGGAIGLAWAVAEAALAPGVSPCLSEFQPADDGTLVLVKSALFEQSDALSVGAAASPAARAALIVQPSPVIPLAHPALNGPGGFQAVLAGPSTDETAWTWSTAYGSEDDMNGALASGAWNLRIDVVPTNGPSFAGFVPWAVANVAPPPVPHFANFEALQSIDPERGFTIAWDAWTGGSTHDRVEVAVVDSRGEVVFSAATDCAGDVRLAAGASSVTVPAGRLLARTRYTLALTFGTTLFAGRDRGALLVERGVQARTTRLAITTAGSVAATAELTNPRLSASGDRILFRITGIPRTTYQVQSSADLVTWTPHSVVTLPINGAAEVGVPIPAGGLPRFWRAVIPEAAAPVRLEISRGTAPTSVRVTIHGTPGVVYRIESTVDWVSWAPSFFSRTIPPGSDRVSLDFPVDRVSRLTAFRAVAAAGP